MYGLGLIGEETNGDFKTYHYDYRGSTTAITDENGDITNTFIYDTYGKLLSRTGTTNTPFLYNGRDGVMTDTNGLFYMRARYYNPTLKRFVNADIIVGEITNSATLNRYAYANGNPVSNIDPFGLSPDKRGSEGKSLNDYLDHSKDIEAIQKNYEYSKMFSESLQNILSVLNDISLSGSMKERYTIDALTSVYYSITLKGGSGNINLKTTIDEQMNMLGSFTVTQKFNGITVTGSKSSLQLTTSAIINEYSTLNASSSYDFLTKKLNMAFDITTKTKNDSSVTLSLGLDKILISNNKTTSLQQQMEKAKQASGQLAFAFSIVGVTIAEDVATGGIGITNDAASLIAARELIQSALDLFNQTTNSLPAHFAPGM